MSPMFSPLTATSPASAEGQLVLANCPFRALAEEYREIICPMNLRLLKGVLKGAAAKDLAARPDLSLGSCCVTIECRLCAISETRVL